MLDADQFITESLEYGNIERGTKVALIVMLSLFPACPRCPEGASDTDSALTKAWWGNPVTHTDAGGPTCYDHAALDAVPVENWRALLFASVARSLPGDDVDNAAIEAIHYTDDWLPSDRSLRAGRLFRVALRAYASRWGDDEDVTSYATEVPAKAERLGLWIYAVVANDPRIRPAEIIEGFALYRRLRWPKGGDACPDRFCKGVMVSVETGTRIRGEDPMIFCPVHKAEADRWAALTPEERRLEDEASRERLRAKLKAVVRKKKAERERGGLGEG